MEKVVAVVIVKFDINFIAERVKWKKKNGELSERCKNLFTFISHGFGFCFKNC